MVVVVEDKKGERRERGEVTFTTVSMIDLSKKWVEAIMTCNDASSILSSPDRVRTSNKSNACFFSLSNFCPLISNNKILNVEKKKNIH